MYRAKPEEMWPGIDPRADPPGVAWLCLPDPEELDAEERAAFDYIMRREERKFRSIPTLRDSGLAFRQTPLFLGLLQSPRVAELWAHFGDFYQTAEGRGSFSHRDRELAEFALGPLLGTGASAIHIADAVGTGFSPRDIKAILDGRLEDLDAADRQIVEYVRAAARGELDVEMFEALVARMGVKTAVEYTSYVTYAIGRHRTVQAMMQIQGIRKGETAWAATARLLQAYIDGDATPHNHDRSASWVEKEEER